MDTVSICTPFHTKKKVAARRSVVLKTYCSHPRLILSSSTGLDHVLLNPSPWSHAHFFNVEESGHSGSVQLAVIQR